MTIAIWLIAICEIIRALQNMLSLTMVKQDTSKRSNLYEEFIRSLKSTDKEFIHDLLKEFEKESEE